MEISQKKRKVTIYDVARHANCSTATVSLALNNDPRVKEDTRLSILDWAEKLSYKPNYLAKGLAEQRSFSIGVILPELGNPVFSEIINGIESFLSTKDYHTIIGVTNFSLEKEKYYINMLSAQRVDGLIILSNFLEEIKGLLLQLQEESLPFVLSGNRLKGLDVNYIVSDMTEGGFLAIEHLIHKGHKNIAFLSGQLLPQQSYDRLEGYKKALSIYGLPYREGYVLTCEQSFPVIRSTVRSFLETHREVTAIFCLYDFIAMAAIKGIYDLGLSVPKDIAVVGYDNISIAEYFTVGLTSIDPNNYKIGEMSARMVINVIEGHQKETQSITLTPALIEREST